jgi:hypothetical protein
VIGSAGRLAGGALHDPEVEAFLRLDGEPPVAQVDDPSAAEVLSADRDHRHLKQPLQQPHRRGRADDAATAAPWSRNAPGWFSGWRRCSRTPGSADQRRLALLTKSGRAILEALLTGQDDPDALAALARGRLCVKISPYGRRWPVGSGSPITACWSRRCWRTSTSSTPPSPNSTPPPSGPRHRFRQY